MEAFGVGVCLLAVAWLGWDTRRLYLIITDLLTTFESERRAWQEERRALMERAVPGLVIGQPDRPTNPRLAGEAGEWMKERAKLTAMGLEDEDLEPGP